PKRKHCNWGFYSLDDVSSSGQRLCHWLSLLGQWKEARFNLKPSVVRQDNTQCEGGTMGPMAISTLEPRHLGQTPLEAVSQSCSVPARSTAQCLLRVKTTMLWPSETFPLSPQNRTSER